MKHDYAIQCLSDTQEVARDLANCLKAGDVVALEGNLGAGKTTLTRFIAQELGVTDYVNSPTFTLINEYKAKELTIYHLDFYRLNHESELQEIGFEDCLAGGGLTLIEWADRFPQVLPPNTYHLKISVDPTGDRSVEIRRD